MAHLVHPAKERNNQERRRGEKSEKKRELRMKRHICARHGDNKDEGKRFKRRLPLE